MGIPAPFDHLYEMQQYMISLVLSQLQDVMGMHFQGENVFQTVQKWSSCIVGADQGMIQ